MKHWHHHYIEHTHRSHIPHIQIEVEIETRNSNSNLNVITISSHRHIFHIQFVYLFTYNKSISLIFVMPISQFGSYDEMHWVRNGMMFEKTWRFNCYFFSFDWMTSYSNKIRQISTLVFQTVHRKTNYKKRIQLTDH